jgi:hypothetical protein
MRHTHIFVSLLFATSLLYAQQSETAPHVFIANGNQPLTITSCPVGFTAERRLSMEVIPIGAGHGKAHQQLRLNLLPRNGRAITEASVTVHGSSNPGLMLPVEEMLSAEERIDHEATQDFQLKPQPGEPGLTLTTVSTHEITAIRWVDLTSLTYADSTSWHATDFSQCRAHISRLLLVQ